MCYSKFQWENFLKHKILQKPRNIGAFFIYQVSLVYQLPRSTHLALFQVSAHISKASMIEFLLYISMVRPRSQIDRT